MSASKKKPENELTEDKEKKVNSKKEVKKTDVDKKVKDKETKPVKKETTKKTEKDQASKTKKVVKKETDNEQVPKTRKVVKREEANKQAPKTAKVVKKEKEDEQTPKTRKVVKRETANKQPPKTTKAVKKETDKETAKPKKESSKEENSKTKNVAKKETSKEESTEAKPKTPRKKTAKEQSSETKKQTKKVAKKEPKAKEEKSKPTENKGNSQAKKVEIRTEYIEAMIKKAKRKTIIAIITVIIIIVFLLLSTVFALLNLDNTNIISGVKVKNIDLSNLSIEDSTNKLQEALNNELLEDVKLKYGEEYEITLSPSQIEFEYDVKSAIDDAYSVGRNGNILQNNYEILSATLFEERLGIKYAYNDEFLNEFIDDVSSKVPGLVVNSSYYIEDENLIINQGTDGIVVSKEELKELILKSIENRRYENIYDEDYNPVIEIPVEECKAEAIDIDKIYSEVKSEPQDAYFELEPYQIYPEQDGVDFDLEAAKKAISNYEEEYTIPLIITKASKTIKDLGMEAFPYLISSFSTQYDASNVNRSTNLVIAANKINGTVLMPGEVFSYNKVVGKRTVEEGYKDAKIYADGGVVDGLAGGICQISSTLYNAVLLANLEIVERRNHTYTTSYVAAGRDATVVYGSIDFQFKNSRNYPIKIEASVNNGVAEFKIHGMNEENEYEIEILPVTTASIPYSVQYVQNASLAPGTQVVTQSGHAGYKVTTYIEKRLNGELVSREVLSNDIYSPMKSIVNVGPGVAEQ